MKTLGTLPAGPIVVLGAGFIGSALVRSLVADDCSQRVVATRTRLESQTDATVGEAAIVEFRLEDPATWSNLPADASAFVWTFPASGSLGAEAEAHAKTFRREVVRATPLCVLSTTSCYVVNAPDLRVDESFPVDTGNPRFVAEEALRRDGATLLVLSGLFGPHRTPWSWLARGLIKDLRGTVNLVHQDDVVRALRAWLEDPVRARGQRLNWSTQTHEWRELAQAFRARNLIPADLRIDFEGAVNRPPAAVTSRRFIVSDRIRALYPELGATPYRDVRDSRA